MTQFYMICFDIADSRRLRRVSNQLENFGQRVQLSVFECWLDENDLFKLKRRLARELDPTEDQVRYYPLCTKDISDIRIDGSGEVCTDIPYTIR